MKYFRVYLIDGEYIEIGTDAVDKEGRLFVTANNSLAGDWVENADSSADRKYIGRIDINWNNVMFIQKL